MDKRLGAIRDVMVTLADLGMAPIREGPVGELGDLYEDVLRLFTPATSETIEAAFASGDPVGGLHGMGQFLYLEVVNDDRPLIPVVSFNYDFSDDREEFRLRVGLLGRSLEGTMVSAGFRFETREGPTGVHRYYHSQMISSIGVPKGSDPLPADHWVPESQPAFPLDADNPTALLVCFLVSLYGPDRVRGLLTNGLLNFMKSAISGMHSVKYWFSEETEEVPGDASATA